MVGDTTNLTTNQKAWHFHTDDPLTDMDHNLNRHFDSLEGLHLEEAFNGGMDCVFIMSCGPFDLEVGEEVPISFTIVFGEDQADLTKNATFAQVMYNSHYQATTNLAPPNLNGYIDENNISLSWDSIAEETIDFMFGYDFEGYRLYRSVNSGFSWGDPLYDTLGVQIGWEPYAQFDLTLEEDIENFGYDISGPDPLAPWFNLGSNTGIAYSFTDASLYLSDSLDNIFCYYLTAYDTGLPEFGIDQIGGFWPEGFPSLASAPSNVVCINLFVPGSPGSGDINGDGMLDILDVVGIVGLIIGSFDAEQSQFDSADYDSNGVVDVLDVVLIVNIILEY